MSDLVVTLIGVLEWKVFSNPENGFFVGSFLEENTSDPVRVTGIMNEYQEQVPIKLTGSWGYHPKYGRQFSFIDFDYDIQPSTQEGIERYLSSGVFPGIGPKISKRIYQMFGDKTL